METKLLGVRIENLYTVIESGVGKESTIIRQDLDV